MSWPEPFFVRALIAATALAVIAAPLGCVIIWRRMAYVGETLAQASLLGVALGLALQINLTFAVVVAAVIAAMVLIDERRMKLDQPIADFIPAFSRMQVLESPDGALSEVHPAKRQITVRQLLTHTSGLTYNAMQTGPIKRAYEEAGIIPALASRHAIPDFPLLAAAPDLATYADRLASLPLVHEPGTHWNYSVSFDLLGRLIEVASGQRLESFMKARIFQPLGMTSTWFQVPASEAKRLTTNFHWSNASLDYHAQYVLAGIGWSF